MAVDSAQKRFSMLGFGSPLPAMVTVPSGTVGTAARADLLYLYSGITLQTQALQAIASLFYIVSGAPAHYTTDRGPVDYIVS